MNGTNFNTHPYRRRLSDSSGNARSYDSPGDINARAKDYNEAVIFTDVTELDANAQVTRIVEDSWNGEAWVQIATDVLSTVDTYRKTVSQFGGFLRVRYEVDHSAQSSQVGATFGGGVTYKQS